MRVKVFLLVAKGYYLNFSSSGGTLFSKTAFLRQKTAEKAIEGFKQRCIGEGLMELDPKTLKVTIMEAEIDPEDLEEMGK